MLFCLIPTAYSFTYRLLIRFFRGKNVKHAVWHLEMLFEYKDFFLLLFYRSLHQNSFKSSFNSFNVLIMNFMTVWYDSKTHPFGCCSWLSSASLLTMDSNICIFNIVIRHMTVNSRIATQNTQLALCYTFTDLLFTFTLYAVLLVLFYDDL